jgi:hypothetical protein
MSVTNPATWYTGPDILDGNGKSFRQREEAGPWAIPPAFQVSAVFNSTRKVFWHGGQDAALRNDPDFALKIEQDPHVQRVLRERTDGVLSLKLGLVVDDDRDPVNRAIRDSVWATMEETYYRIDMLRHLHKNGSWAGKTAVQPVYEWRVRRRPDPKNPKEKIDTKCPVITSWVTTDGDSIGFRWDGTPYVLVNPTYSTDLPDAELINTNINRAVVLSGTWRDKFILHRHQAGTIPYWYGERGSAAFGTGIRNVIYYLVWLRSELMSNILDYTGRTGLGVKVWRYQAGNDQSKEAVAHAARNQANILLPTFPNAAGKIGESVEILDTSTAGANLLLQILRQYNDEVALYVIGQTLSSGTEGSGLGGAGVAGMHSSTKHQIISLDAQNLAASLTTEWVQKVAQWQHPEYAGRVSLRAEFETNPPDAGEQIDNARKVFDMGGTLPVSYLNKLAGIPNADEGEETLSMAQLQQAQQAMMPQPEMGGGVPGDGDGDGIGFEEESEDPDMSYIQDAAMRELEGAGV